MKVEIKDGNLVVTVPLDGSPHPSKSGKTLIVASSHGIVSTDAKVDGKAVQVGLNAFISK